ncbi:MAG: TrbC/VirB2 family protein [Treponema sp.]|jgi:type IV secretory pathway VirB2 component (pilin)|nr:TrbC/VirB2 family protein [Treponema sp.]
MFTKIVLMLLLSLLNVLPLFAQDLPAGMSSLMDTILTWFTGGFVRTILVLCLVGSAIAYGFNKDNEKVKRNIIAIGIAIAIVIGASGIVDMIWEASGGSVG